MNGASTAIAPMRKTSITVAAMLAAVMSITLTGSPASASNPLMKSSDRAQVLADGDLDGVKGSGVYSDYYGYYGHLYAYYAYIYSYYGRYYYPSNSNGAANSYYTAYQYSWHSYLNNAYAYAFSVNGY